MALQPFARKVVDPSQARSSNAREIIPSHVADIERSMKEEISDNEFPILVYVHSQHKMDALGSIDARLPYPVTILVGLVAKFEHYVSNPQSRTAIIV